MRKPPSNKVKRILKIRAKKLERMRRARIKKAKNVKRRWLILYQSNKPYREQAKEVRSYLDAINLFMPDNLRYLLQHSNSPFHKPISLSNKKKKIGIIKLPVTFSILENPKQSYQALNEIVSVLISQKYAEVWIDYQDRKSVV